MCESVESGHTKQDAAAEVVAKLGVTAEPVRMDSQCKYAAVAMGLAEVYLRLPTRPGYVERIWDHAAGVVVLEEAGGAVTDVEGRPLDFSRGRGLSENRGVIATNGPCHAKVVSRGGLGRARRSGVTAADPRTAGFSAGFGRRSADSAAGLRPGGGGARVSAHLRGRAVW